MNTFKQQCIALREKDHTLNEITAITGRSKTSIYFHIKNIALSEKKRKEIASNTKERAIKIAASRKGKSTRSFREFTVWDETLVLLVAHLLFDGEINKSRCVYSNRNQVLVNHVASLMKKLYKYKPVLYQDKKTRVCRISYYNVALSNYLHGKSQELLRNIYTQCQKIFRGNFCRHFLTMRDAWIFAHMERKNVCGDIKTTRMY